MKNLLTYLPWPNAPSHGFKYTPLTGAREVRLLILQPGQDNEMVTCHLRSTVIDNSDIDFEAISYCWGDLRKKRSIICEGRRLRVTTNLFDALRHLRGKDHTRMLWADAVCVNQDDLEERSRQIVLMPDIFKSARQVLIWLGNAFPGIDKVENMIKTCSERLPSQPDDVNDTTMFLEDLGTGLLERADLNMEIDREPFVRLLKSPWFRRKWVIQEVCLAKDAVIVCGHVQFPWCILASYAAQLIAYGDYLTYDLTVFLNEMVYPLNNIASIFTLQTLIGKMGLLDCIKATSKFQCTDPRDHIFSLLNLSSEQEQSLYNLIPEYKISPAEVYTKFATRFLLRGGDIGVLSLAPNLKQSMPLQGAIGKATSVLASVSSSLLRIIPGTSPALSHLPSWVPDLTGHGIDCVAGYSLQGVSFAAGGSKKQEIHIDGRSLKCTGIIIDQIKKQVLSPLEYPTKRVPANSNNILKSENGPNTLKQINWLRQCVALAGGTYGLDMPPERFAALWKALIMERAGVYNRVERDLSPQFQEYLTNVFKLDDDDDETVIQAYELVAKHIILIENHIVSFAAPRRFSLTAKDRLGLMPRTSKEGDLICILLGGAVPFVIRPAGKGTFKLLGDCYLHGVMDGEALKTDDPREIVLT
jgi:hypothetical protein